jgi:hypothetical protein
MHYKKYLNEAFNVNFDANKSARSPKEWDDFIAYEEKLFRLKKLAFEAGYDLAIRWFGTSNSKNGFYDILKRDDMSFDMNSEPVKPIKSFESMEQARTWILSNYNKK